MVIFRVKVGFMGRVRIRVGVRKSFIVRVPPSLLNRCQGVSDGDCEGGKSYVCEASPLTRLLTQRINPILSRSPNLIPTGILTQTYPHGLNATLRILTVPGTLSHNAKTEC